MKVKRIAILSSGGDAPGMNTAIFGVFSACRDNNVKCFAFIGGYEGLIDNNIVELKFNMLQGNINRGGSLIKSSRSARFLKPTYFKKAVQNLKDNKIDCLIVLGGDGSLKGATELKNAGINVIIIPSTIDNDMNFSFTLGYDTATNNIVNAVDNITDSISAFDYGAVVKIMGRDCPNLINSVAASLHTNFIVSSSNFNLNKLTKEIKEKHNNDNLPTVVLVLEDCIDCVELAKTLQEKCKFQFRPHILGYIQRGGTPSAFDRRYGYSAGYLAVDCALKNEYGFAIGMDGNSLNKKSFEETLKFN